MKSSRCCTSVSALLLAIGVAIPTRAETMTSGSTEERLQRIEAQLTRLEKRLGETVDAEDLAPTIKEYGELTHQLGWDGKSQLTVVKPAGKEQKLSIGGFIQAQAEVGDAPDSRYTGIFNRIFLRRARLTLKGSFSENFDFTMQSDISNNAIAGVSGYRAQATDVFINWSKFAAANVQVGQFKTPFGYEQLINDPKTLTIERSLVNDQLAVNRQLGLGVSGTVANKIITYSVGLFNGNGANNGANDNDQFMYAGRVAAQVWTKGADKFSIGTNGYSSRDTGTFTGHRTAWGVDSQVTLGRFDLAAEYLRTLQNRITGADTNADGWYALVAYYVVPKTMQAVVRVESYDANTHVPASTSTATVFGFNYYIKGDDLKLLFNYTLGDPAGPLAHQGRFSSRFQLLF